MRIWSIYWGIGWHLTAEYPKSTESTKAKTYLEMKIQDLEVGKQKFSTYNQVHQINLLVDEIRDIKNRLQVQK